jgi:hypothetical protein
MSVIGSSGTLLDNVNRWRGQLQLPPIDERTLAETVEESKAGEAKMWIVDLRGKASGGGMTAPFAGGAGAPSRPTSPAERQTLGLPADHPPVAADGGPVNAADAVPFKFTVPESWQPHPATGMRRLAFIVEDGQRRAEVTVIDLMASAPSIADPLQNINRWRMEIGMAPTTKDQLDRLAREIKVDNKPTNYIELIPDPAEAAESQAKQATIAAAVPAGNMIWFFKMRGDRDLVVAERDKFKSFLDSIRFQSDGGAGDGN